MIKPEYNDKLAAEINGIVRKVIRLNKKGVRIVLTNIDYILNGRKNRGRNAALPEISAKARKN